MGWFFGCFGGAGRKARKHGPPPPSQKVSQRRPFQPLPSKVSPPSLIAVEAFTIREDTSNNEDLRQETQFLRSTLAKTENGVLCQEPTERTRDKQNQGNPWSQLDDLEEELEDLRKQIEKETLDAKKIKEEVTFLRSCGTLLQTPAELRKKDRSLEIQQGSAPSKGWHSWLVPSSPISKLQVTEPLKPQLQNEDLEAHDPCPANACCKSPHGAQTPIVENRRQEGDGHSASPCMLMHDSISSLLGQEKQEIGCNISGLQNTMAALHGVDKCEDVLWSVSGILSATSPCKQGDVMVALPNEKSQISSQCTKNAISMRENYPSDQKRCKRLATTDSAREDEDMPSRMLGHVEQIDTSSGEPVFFRSNKANMDVTRTPKIVSHRYHTEESSNCVSYIIPQSPSLSEMTDDSRDRFTPASFTSSSYHDHCATSNAASHGKQYQYSGSSCMNRSCFNRHDDSHVDTSNPASSSSTDSEKTLTDLCAVERSFTPSHTQNTHESVTSCTGDESASSFCAEEEAASATLHSHGSTQYSVAQTGWRTTRAVTYDFEHYETEGKKIFSDAISHVYAECNHTHTSSNYEQRSSHAARFVREEHPNLIETPNKMSQWLATPEPQRTPRVRSRPASPVLTPVQSASQWRQLKRRENHLEMMGLELNDHKTSSARQRPEVIDKEGWDENEPAAWATKSGRMHLCKTQMDNCRLASEREFASHWPFPEQKDVETLSSSWAQKLSNASGELVGSSAETLPVGADMSLSHWLRASTKQDDKRCSVISPPAGLSRHQSPSERVDERPILGIISGENYWNPSTIRGEWDGKGIPNTTTKYKEDQRVNWHASPFETRLERALFKQGEVLHKKLFEVASATPVSNRLKSLH